MIEQSPLLGGLIPFLSHDLTHAIGIATVGLVAGQLPGQRIGRGVISSQLERPKADQSGFRGELPARKLPAVTIKQMERKLGVSSGKRCTRLIQAPGFFTQPTQREVSRVRCGRRCGYQRPRT